MRRLLNKKKKIQHFCSKYYHKYKLSKGVIPPAFLRKRLANLHLPGHSEILVYAFHHAKLIDKNDIREEFDHDSLRKRSKEMFSKLSENLSKFVPLRFCPDKWFKMLNGFIYSLLQDSTGTKVNLGTDREILWSKIVKTSASGAPYYCKKGDLRKEFDDIFDSILNGTFDRSVFNQPNIIYTVSQPSKSGKIKQRLIFCPPFAVTVLELFFYANLCDSFNRNNRSSIVMGYSQMDLFNMNLDFKDYYKS